MDPKEIRRLVKGLKTNLYYIRATRVSKYWSGVGKNLEEAINLAEEIDRVLGEEVKKVEGSEAK
ncbi:hypothetical protein JCM16138_11250 [Thermococcus atlanticus]